MSNIHENLQKILHAVWGKDVRQAIHDAIHDCYEDGSAGSTDLIAREEIEELEATKATRIELAEETADRLAEVAVERGRIDNLVTSGTGVTNATKRTETTLFSASVPCFGNVSGNSGYFNLEDDIENYDYIKIRYNAFGRTGIVDCKPADISASGTLGSSVFHWSEIQPNWETTSLDNPRTVFRHMDFSASNISSGNTHRLSIDAVVFGWNGDATSNGKISDSFAISWDSSKSLYVASGFAGGIYSIIGVKYTDAGVDKDTELTDIRTGVDGTVYQTAGGAVRGQIEDITNRLDGIESNFGDEYDSTATYAVGDRCVYGGVWYECNTAISTAEDWTEAHWDKVSFGDITDQVAQNTADIAENASEISSLKEDLNIASGVKRVAFTNGGYITTNGGVGSTVTLTPTSNSVFCYAIENCSAGDTFLIKATGWTTGRLWAFIDEDNKILSVASNSTDASATPLTVVAPIGAVKCVMNAYKSSLVYVYHGKTVPVLLDTRVGVIENELYPKYNDYVQGAISVAGAFVTNSAVVRTNLIPVDAISSISSPVGFYTRLGLYSSDSTSAFIEANSSSQNSSYVYTKETFATSYPTAKYCAIHYQKYSEGSAVSVTVEEVSALKLITLQSISRIDGQIKSIQSDVSDLLDITSQYFCIENQTLTQTLTFDVPYKDQKYKNQIIESYAMYTGDTAPTIKVSKKWYNGTHTSLNTYYSTPAYVIGGKGEYKRKAFRVAPHLPTADESFKVTITIPEGTTLYIKSLANFYDDSISREVCDFNLNAHGYSGFSGPGQTLIQFEMAAKLGYKYCITIPKVTSDGVYVCLHDDDSIQGTARNDDGTTIAEEYQDIPVSGFTYAQLQQFDFGIYRGYPFKGERIPLLEDFFKICARTGMHPMLSVHPSLSGHWGNIKAMAKKYGVLHQLNIKSDPTSIEVPMAVLLDDIESYTIDTSVSENFVSRFDSLSETYGIVNAKKTIEYNYNAITDALITATLNGGYRCGCFNYGSALSTVEALIEKGVTEFTEDYNSSVGLNW